MGSNALLFFSLLVGMGVSLSVIRMWLFVSTVGGRAHASRIAESNAHLSFDERIAERMRELEKEGAAGPVAGTPTPATSSAPSAPFASPALAPPPQSFGHRGV